MPSASHKELRRVIEYCRGTNLRFSTIPDLVSIASGKVQVSQMREVDINDLLGRAPVTLDIDLISQFLTGKTIIVTGAGGGLGRAHALLLASHGAKVVVNDLGGARDGTGKGGTAMADQVVQEIKDAGGEATANYDGVDTLAGGEAIIKTALDAYGKVDILINNAGTALNLPFEDTGDDDWDAIMKVNARAPFILCREALPWLEQSEIPTIINISSVVGHKGYIRQAAYSASKHALMGFTKALAREVQDRDIRVHALAPGGVATDLVTSMRPDLDTRELIQPEELADIVLFLLLHRGNAVIDEINIRRISNTPWQ